MKTTLSQRWLTLPALGIILATQLPADLATSGGFEYDFSSWEAGGNVAIRSALPYQPTEGGKLAVFNSVNSTPNGYLVIAVEVTPGRRYRMEFDVGNLSYNPQHQRLRVVVEDNVSVPPPPGWRGPYLTDTIDIAGPGGGATAWVEASYDFIPQYEQIRFAFHDVSQATNSLDLVLDHVRMTELPAERFVNGGFESGLDGWYASGNVNVQTASPYGPTEGGKLLAFNSANSVPNGTIFQSVPVIPGQRYRLEFDVGNLSYNPLHQRMLIVVGPIGYKQYPVVDTIDIPGPGGGATAWVAASYEFTAPMAYLPVTFTDLSSDTRSLDLVLDNIRITPVAASGTSFINGSFESGFDGWTVSTTYGGVSLKSSAPYLPTDGGRLAAFNSLNSPNFGSLSQTIDTIPGKSYQLVFDVGNLSYNNQSQRIRVLVDFGNQRVLNIATGIPASPYIGGTNWIRDLAHPFTASGTKATITFIDASDATNGIDLVLDHVRIVP